MRVPQLAVFTSVFDPDGGLELNGIRVGTTAWGNATWDTDAPMFSSDYGIFTHGGGTVQELEIHAGLIYIDSPVVEIVSIGVNGDSGFFGIGSEGGYLQGRHYAYPGPREAWISLNAPDPSLVPVGPEALFDFDPTIWTTGQLAFYGSIGSQPPHFQAYATITSVSVPEPAVWWVLESGLVTFTATRRRARQT
jgi:hypothetical protein